MSQEAVQLKQRGDAAGHGDFSFGDPVDLGRAEVWPLTAEEINLSGTLGTSGFGIYWARAPEPLPSQVDRIVVRGETHEVRERPADYGPDGFLVRTQLMEAV